MNRPQTLKGFRDFFGDQLRLRKQVFNVFEQLFREYGFEGLETPALEYADVLLGKYGEDEKLVYRFTDSGERDVAMRYDLTVPTARVLAQYQHELPSPWKRYQIQPVWRADNTQRGRYREFYQLDADVFGSSEMMVEAELMLLGNKALSRLGFDSYRLRVNSRKVLNAIASYSGKPGKFADIVSAVDKWDKRTPEETRLDLINRLGDEQAADRVLQVVSVSGDNNEVLSTLSELLADIPEGVEGISEMREIVTLTGDPDWLAVDPVIARGLAYYTGPVWEWEISDGNIGSVGGGGRYDCLVASLGGPDMPAAGTSFGIERLLDIMQERNMSIAQGPITTQVLVTVMSEELAAASLAIAEELRDKGLTVSLYPQVRKLGKQLDYANKNSIPFVVIAGEDEVKADEVVLKDMTGGTQESVRRAGLADFIRARVD
ncbi:MAG: Histidine--tRNA ligase [candidate division WS6 bacterium OLB20]|uniref:Histidine--tRNA ligase n=1 Tax=candidate division WS6 bacterium OLB20 TaxID=1617426 RepID=A0A136M0G7_9BACT|nr:MAG: Histidine--tRNA ligase [candidate division WS6 bacterium OLB20]